jgi:hypothetical protein
MEQKARHDIPLHEAAGQERLLELAAFLDGLPADSLTFTCWYAHGKGCAVGLAAAQNPWFQAQGLHLERDDGRGGYWPAYGGRTDRAAVSAFFGISLADVRELFDPYGYHGAREPHPKRVASKIRGFLQRRSVA